VRRCAAGITFKSLLLELVAFLDDLGDPAGIPIDHRRIAFWLPRADQPFLSPVAHGFAVRRKGNLEGMVSVPGAFELARCKGDRRCQGEGKENGDWYRRPSAQKLFYGHQYFPPDVPSSCLHNGSSSGGVPALTKAQ
jgi:hypothetical protein